MKEVSKKIFLASAILFQEDDFFRWPPQEKLGTGGMVGVFLRGVPVGFLGVSRALLHIHCRMSYRFWFPVNLALDIVS